MRKASAGLSESTGWRRISPLPQRDFHASRPSLFASHWLPLGITQYHSGNHTSAPMPKSPNSIRQPKCTSTIPPTNAPAAGPSLVPHRSVHSLARDAPAASRQRCASSRDTLLTRRAPAAALVQTARRNSPSGPLPPWPATTAGSRETAPSPRESDPPAIPRTRIPAQARMSRKMPPAVHRPARAKSKIASPESERPAKGCCGQRN